MNESTDDDDPVEMSSDNVQMVDLGDAKTETMQYFPGGIITDNMHQLGWG